MQCRLKKSESHSKITANRRHIKAAAPFFLRQPSVARLPSVRMLSAVRRLYAGPALGLFLRPHTPQKRSLDEGSPECNLVTDYRTFIEDFQRLVRFVDYLNVLKL